MKPWMDWKEALTGNGVELQPRPETTPRVSRVPALLACLVIVMACQRVLQVPIQTSGSPITPTSGSGDGQSIGEVTHQAVHFELKARELLVPVQGFDARALRDTFDDPRSGGRTHEALDIMAPRGRPVVAVESGTVAKMRRSPLGGITLYLFDPTRSFAYYYAHLEGYAAGLAEGAAVEKGQVIGFVGSTGNAPDSAPHLHFAIYRTISPTRWWGGEPINPYSVFGGK